MAVVHKMFIEHLNVEGERTRNQNLKILLDAIQGTIDHAVNNNLGRLGSIAFDAAEYEDNEFNEDLTEKKFNQIVLELMLSDTSSEAEYQLFADTVINQSQQLLWIGQYAQFLDILKVFENNQALQRFIKKP